MYVFVLFMYMAYTLDVHGIPYAIDGLQSRGERGDSLFPFKIALSSYVPTVFPYLSACLTCLLTEPSLTIDILPQRKFLEV